MENEISAKTETEQQADAESEEKLLELMHGNMANESPAIAEVKEDPEVKEQPSFEDLYHTERLAHEVTKSELKDAQAFVARAKAMGFTGAGIHTGA